MCFWMFLGHLFHLVVPRHHEPLVAFQSKDRASVLPTSPLAGQLINRAPFFWSGGGEFHRGFPGAVEFWFRRHFVIGVGW